MNKVSIYILKGFLCKSINKRKQIEVIKYI